MADNGSQAAGGTGADAGPAPLDQPTTPEQQAQMFASDPPVEFDPLGQALLTAPINAVTDLARSIIWGGVHAAEEVGAFLFAEAAENAVDKAYDAVHEGNGADQGASVSDQAGGDQAGGDQPAADQTDQGSGDQPADDSAPAKPDTTEPSADGPGIGQVR